jgi:hypothetical protein
VKVVWASWVARYVSCCARDARDDDGKGRAGIVEG